MRKLATLILCMALALSLAGCSRPEEEKTEVIVFAAASLEAVLTDIAADYPADVELVFNFDSSGTLRTQIREGAACDLFISAGQKQMNDLQDMILPDSRVDLVENKVVLAVPEGNPAGIGGYADLTTDKLTLLCLGNEDVPVGSYSLDILKNLGIDLAALESAGKVTYGSNVTEVAAQIKEGTVDCGIIYATDAHTHGLQTVDEATEALCGRVIYPAALLDRGNEDSTGAAQAFLDHLRADAGAVAVLEGVGFTVLP